jgi:flagellar assembly factor FliW
MVAKKPFNDSLVNFLGPIVINVDNNKMAQVVLDDVFYPQFGAAEPLSSYVVER